jgi:hypothetical protein
MYIERQAIDFLTFHFTILFSARLIISYQIGQNTFEKQERRYSSSFMTAAKKSGLCLKG